MEKKVINSSLVENYLYSLKPNTADLLHQKMIDCLKKMQLFDKCNLIKKIIVAGTNGKGSTTIILSKVLNEKFKKVGTFISPHLMSITERISINGKDIDYNDFARIFHSNKENIEKNEFCFFEAIFLIAIVYFMEQDCDYLVLEAGIGAMYDVVSIFNSEYGIVTSISKDHCDILGNTIMEIAQNKAHVFNIAKVGLYNSVPKRISEYWNKEFSQLVNLSGLYEFKNHELIFQNKKYYLNNSNFSYYENFCFGLYIAELENIVLDHDFFKDFKIPGRFEYLNENIIIDVSHNPEAINHLIKNIKKIYNKTYNIELFFCCMKDKKPNLLVKKILQKFNTNQLHITSIDYYRSAKKHDYNKNYQDLFIDNYQKYLLENDFSRKILIFFGSFYFVSEIKFLYEENRLLK
ncbi:MAG: Mur ligase family protein [Mycoplasma sp.]